MSSNNAEFDSDWGDYSNTIIYKISCKDVNITDLYVGHTINFVQRKKTHKYSCISDKSSNYNCKVYQISISKKELRNYLESKNIIQKLTNGF